MAGVLITLIGLLLPVASAPRAEASARVSLVDPSLRLGQHATLHGSLGRRVRPVWLQVHAASGWRTIVRSRTTRNGVFRMTDPASRAASFRVVAPRTASLGTWISLAQRTRWESRLAAGSQLRAGQGLRSPNGRFTLVMRVDGDLVLRDGTSAASRAIWRTGTAGSRHRVVMQGDGNLVVYAESSPRWSSETAPATGAYLRLQDDGHVVLYSRGGVALWASHRGRLANTTDALAPATTLAAGQSIHSPDGRHRAVMQGDGNFVVYGPGGAKWSTLTRTSGSRVTLQDDGNLVVYAGARALWSSSTAPASAVRLRMQDDGNLVLYSRGGLALWSSRGGRTSHTQDSLGTGGALGVGRSIVSRDGRHTAIMQSDGNFVVYGPAGATWSSQTQVTGSSVHMQTDGNLVVYGPGSSAQWASRSSGSNARLVMQDDGNLVVYTSSGAAWSSRGGGSGGGTAEFRLPFGQGRRFEISQGPAQHANGPYPDYNRHAVDFRTPTGTPVLAAAAGRISFEGYDSTSAIQVRIDHGSDRCSQYAHLSRTVVNRGQQVQRGQLIGYSGSTGIGTGPHLHFNIVYCSTSRSREVPNTLEMGRNYPVGQSAPSQNSPG